MIYFDNSSTTKNKPQETLDAFNYYMTEIGVSPGRGSYSLGIEASRMLYKARKTVADYFGLSKPNVVFTKNSTEAINLFLNGYLKNGDHVIISCYEHNAVFRPINKLKEEGRIEYSIISRDDMTLSVSEIADKYKRENTKIFITTLASNVTGRLVLNKDLCQVMKSLGVTTFVDASQGAGKYQINMLEDGIEYLAFTGHKDLLGLPGVGGLCSRDKLGFEPLIQGGTGIHGESFVNPDIFPESYEAGTLNMPAIWALKASIEHINKNRCEIKKKEQAIIEYLNTRLIELDNVEIYDREFEKIGCIGINVMGVSSSDLVKVLDNNGICVRGGIHCAILTHKTLGTESIGIVRISPNYLNTKEEIDILINVLKGIGE